MPTHDNQTDNHIKQWRTKKKLTQQSLADGTGLHIRLIQKFESGERDLDNAAATTVQKLAIAFGCKMEDLI